jgi:hypothetical protein
MRGEERRRLLDTDLGRGTVRIAALKRSTASSDSNTSNI